MARSDPPQPKRSTRFHAPSGRQSSGQRCNAGATTGNRRPRRWPPPPRAPSAWSRRDGGIPGEDGAGRNESLPPANDAVPPRGGPVRSLPRQPPSSNPSGSQSSISDSDVRRGGCCMRRRGSNLRADRASRIGATGVTAARRLPTKDVMAPPSRCGRVDARSNHSVPAWRPRRRTRRQPARTRRTDQGGDRVCGSMPSRVRITALLRPQVPCRPRLRTLADRRCRAFV